MFRAPSNPQANTRSQRHSDTVEQMVKGFGVLRMVPVYSSDETGPAKIDRVRTVEPCKPGKLLPKAMSLRLTNVSSCPQ